MKEKGMKLSTVKFGNEDKGVSFHIEIKDNTNIISAPGANYCVFIAVDPSHFIFSDGGSIVQFDHDLIIMMPVFSNNNYDSCMMTSFRVGVAAIRDVYEQLTACFKGELEVLYQGNKQKLVNDTTTDWDKVYNDNAEFGIDDTTNIPRNHYRKYTNVSTDIFPEQVYDFPKKGTIRIISQNLSPGGPWPNISLDDVITDMSKKSEVMDANFS